jgi:CRISPR-associated protein Csd1
MIIQSLVNYYDSLVEAGIKIPRWGYSPANVSFALVISREGDLKNILDLRDAGNKKRLKQIEVPYQKDHTNKVDPHFACDNAKYIFGVDSIKDESKKKMIRSESKDLKILGESSNQLIVVSDRSTECFEKLRAFHHSLLDTSNDAQIVSFLKFLDKWKPEEFLNNQKIVEYKDEILSAGGNFVFDLNGIYLHEYLPALTIWEAYYSALIADNQNKSAQCLVTGKIGPVSRLHKKIKNVYNPQSAGAPGGAPLVSFNKDEFCSYGRDQCYNAPVSEIAMFKYTTVLNYLLEPGSRNKLQIGDVTTVFWADTSAPYLDLINCLIDPSEEQRETKENSSETLQRYDPKTTQLVSDILKKVKTGQRLLKDNIGIDPDNTNFYILGLTANNGRLAVRFWHQDNFGNFVTSVSQHHIDMEILRSKFAPNFISISRLLNATVPRKRIKKSLKKNSQKEKSKSNEGGQNKISPLLGSLLLYAILNNRPYPPQMYSAILNRSKTGDADKYIQLDFVHAGFIKAYLIRLARAGLSSLKEDLITMSLNKENPNIPYRLGRLFAVLESAQITAHKDSDKPESGIKRTIRDSYFASAASNPKVAFPILIKLHQHHLSKINSDKPASWGVKISKSMDEIMSSIDQFPAYMSLDEQGMFMLGYYHQHESFFRKDDEPNTIEEELKP